MSLSRAQHELLGRIVAAEPGKARYLRDIGRLQSAGVEIDGEHVPPAPSSFRVLEARGLVGIHLADRGFGAPAAQRIYVTRAGLEAAAV